jgi:hypothetical protein
MCRFMARKLHLFLFVIDMCFTKNAYIYIHIKWVLNSYPSLNYKITIV